MKHYSDTKKALQFAGLFVHEFPLIWYDTSGKGISPLPGQSPRQTYQTAFLCSLGQRSLITTLSNCYPCHRPQNPIHPSEKPQTMLKHFLSMLVDETTDVFDPTCGSGTALRAAESLGARSIFGLELNPEYVISANAEITRSRTLKLLNQKL